MKFVFLLAVISAYGVAAVKFPDLFISRPRQCVGPKVLAYTPKCWAYLTERHKQGAIEELILGYPACTGVYAVRSQCREVVRARGQLNASDPNYEFVYPQCRGSTPGPGCDDILRQRNWIESVKKDLGINF